MKKNIVTGLLFLVCGLQLNSNPSMNKHVVKKGETLYSISKEYGLKVNEVIKANPVLAKNSGIRIGQQLIIPTGNYKQQTIKYKTVSVPSTPDTPYREEDIRPRAAITGNEKANANIEEEKILPKAQPVIPTEGLRTASSNATEYPLIFNQYPLQGYKIKKNKGAANYLADATAGNQNLAFYSDAETGSVIRVTNMMNHKTVFVKVIGKVPPMDAGKEITIKLSNKAAQDLGAIDEKFLVEVASFSQN